MTESLVMPRLDFIRAGRAVRALLKDPEDLPQVFTVIDSISGTAPHRLLLGFKVRESGRRLLRDRPDILPALSDRASLRALPDGSLGRAYLAFVESEGISPEGIRDASREGVAAPPRSDVFAYLRARMRDTHDLWHAATGYKGDVVGELSLLAFTLGQHWNTGVAFIVAAALVKGFGRNDMRPIGEGFARGRAAKWLPAQEWETLLPLPLDEVRARLGIGPPPVYTPVRTVDLREQGLI
jgi:ubiquinone biosynthesis protein COQ4